LAYRNDTRSRNRRPTYIAQTQPGFEMIAAEEIAARIDRSKSWIIRQALAEWIAEEQRRHELTLEAMKSVDEGRTIPQEEVEAELNRRKEARLRG